MSLNLFAYDNPSATIFDDSAAILTGLSDAEWTRLLSHMQRRKYPAGSVAIEAGQSERALYIIASGSVSIVQQSGQDRETELAIVPAGSTFGEIAFLDGGPRTASVRAREPVEVLVLSFESFEALRAWDANLACRLVLDIGRVVASRLRARNMT
jgi:CRP-like cAMP-binding protein